MIALYYADAPDRSSNCSYPHAVPSRAPGVEIKKAKHKGARDPVFHAGV